MRLYSSEQEVENYIEQLPLEQIKQMLEYNVYSDKFFVILLNEYWRRINLFETCGTQENLTR